MLRLCQGKISPLRGVGLHNCPKPLLRLATQCCDLNASARPRLPQLAAELQGPVLALLEQNGALEPRRPAAPLLGWRAAADGVQQPNTLSDHAAGGATAGGGKGQPAAVGMGAAADQAGVAQVHDYNAPENQPGYVASALAPAADAGVLFSRFDADGSGAMDAAELRALCASLGRELSEEDALQVLAQLDTDGSGAVSFDEFLLWWAQGLTGAGATRPSSRWEGQTVAERDAASRGHVAAAAAEDGRPADATSAPVGTARATQRAAQLERRASNLFGFFDGDTKPEREGPGRISSRRCASRASSSRSSHESPDEVAL